MEDKNSKKQNIINEIRFKLVAYEERYYFMPDEDVEVVTEEAKNTYSADLVWRNGDSITIRILTEWGDEVDLDGREFTEESLKELFEAIQPPKTLFVNDRYGKTVYCVDFARRITRMSDAFDELKEIFYLDWEFIGDENEDVWKWSYKLNTGEEVLTAFFE